MLELVSSTYATELDAHNALARLAGGGTDPVQRTVGAAGAASTVGVAFRTTVDPADGARDWEFSFAKGTTLVEVKTAVNDTSEDAFGVAQAVYPKF